MACGNSLSQKHSQTVGVGGCGGGVKGSGEVGGCEGHVEWAAQGEALIR